MGLALADRITLARLVLAPLAAASYLYLPIDGGWCFWFCAWLCAFAEISDWLDGKVARARGEVSDFGKLADPFCDVLYRMSIFLVYLLPAGGVGYVVSSAGPGSVMDGGLLAGEGLIRSALIDPANLHGHPIHVTGWADGKPLLGTGMVPWLPVFLMVLREIIAGALRAMTATKGLVLAARSSGKFKAWLQGITIITLVSFPAVFQRAPWHLSYGYWATWICCLVSIGSIIEYIWVNRTVLRQLAVRRAG